MYQGHFRGKVSEKQGFLYRRVAATNDHHFATAIEKSVAGGAGGDAKSLQPGLGLQAQPARLGASGDDQGITKISIAAVTRRLEGSPAEVDRSDDIVDEVGAYLACLLGHLFH